MSVCLFVCLFVSRISHKLLVGFWWNLVSREVMIIGRPSSKLGVIRIEIRIWNLDNCFSWTTGNYSVGKSIVLKMRGSRVGTSVWTNFFVCLFVRLFVCLFGEGKIKGFRGICALRVPFSSSPLFLIITTYFQDQRFLHLYIFKKILRMPTLSSHVLRNLWGSWGFVKPCQKFPNTIGDTNCSWQK